MKIELKKGRWLINGLTYQKATANDKIIFNQFFIKQKYELLLRD